MPLTLTGINDSKISDFRFKDFGGQYLLSKDTGDFCFLDSGYFQSFIRGNTEKIPPVKLIELKNKGFVNNFLDPASLSQKYALRNKFLFHAPSLHIIVVSLRCDHACVYCQASAKTGNGQGWDMNEQTAKKVVDAIFQSPNKSIMIEFQGGEPLLNFGIIKFVVDYAKRKNRTFKKNLRFSVVSNFANLDEKKIDYFISNDVALCTSLDGPEVLHNKNRITAQQSLNSYRNVVKWIKVIEKKRKSGKYKYRVNALTTITRSSLDYPVEIVDEYVKLGLEGIHLRPVAPFGTNKENSNGHLNFSDQEFMVFYKKAIKHILDINRKGKFFYERTARMFLIKMLTDTDHDYVDLRSPCGAGLGQLAYNYNGDVYTCDEGRMFSAGLSDESFRLGNVNKNDYSDFIDNEVVKTLCFASCLDNVPRCADCVYKAYCGVCPLYNYAVEGNLFSKTCNTRCRINRGILDFLFTTLETPAMKIYESWVK